MRAIKFWGQRKAFTMVELLIAAMVLVIAILSTAFGILNISDMGELSREKIVAVTDAGRTLEAMRNTANSSLAILQNTDWTAWALTNVVNAKSTNEISLNQESIQASFSNPANIPVQVTLTVNWLHKQRNYSYRVITLMTDRT